MSVLKKIGALVPIVLVVISITACDRNITREETIVQASNCFDCHSDQNTFLVAAEEQWMRSVHASGLNIDRGSSATCAACHISEGFIQRANGETVTSEDNPTVIHCFTCHAPQSTGDFRLRWTADALLQNGETFDLSAGNLCVACHQARRNVNTYVGTVGTDVVTISSTHWGPHHSNQGDMLLGSNGYEYDGYVYDRSEHRTATDDGCVDCHKNRATSNNIVGGHSFNMRGILRDEGGNEEEVLNTGACADCHGGLDDFNVNNVQTEIDSLIGELETLVEAAGLWTNGHPNAGVTTSVDSAGAVWNLLMAEGDRSHGVHNAKYTRGLLESAIMFMSGARQGPRVESADLVLNR